MRKLLMIPIVGFLIVGLALPALAHSFTGEGDCDGWTLHLDGTWNAYDITVDGTSIGLEQNPQIADGSDATERTFVVHWWKQGPDVERTVTVERVLDCDDDETTTTLPEETTTTTVAETTSTVPEETTTTLPDTTTSLPGVAEWDAGSTCESISVVFGEGISAIEIHMLDGVPGTDELVGDLENPFTETGSQEVRVGTPTRFRLIPVVESGFTASPEVRDVTVPVCEDVPVTTVPPDAPELPFTGFGSGLVFSLAAVGLVALGISTVRASKRIR